MKRKLICNSVLLSLLLFLPLQLSAQTDFFELNKQHYMDTEGSELRYHQEAVWAYLEKLRLGQINRHTYMVWDASKEIYRPVGDFIHDLIQCWGTFWTWDGQHYPPYTYAWKWAAWQEHAMLCWVLYKYGDVIEPADKQFLETLFLNMSQSPDISPGSANAQVVDITARYLFCQDHQGLTVQYSYDPPINSNIYAFQWEGKTYVPGQVYNAYEFTRDWLNYRMNLWVNVGCNEFDTPAYTWTYFHAFYTLYEFAKDPLMKRKAKMMADFLILESVLDFTANQWGGALGRFYEDNIKRGTSSFYWSIFWNMCKPSHEPSYSIMISSYRLPEVMVDIGDLSDEPDNYYHINTEYNASIARTANTGKWNFVTKYYSLGGARGSSWQLCVASDDEPGSYKRPGVPFRMWINTLDTGEDVSNPVDYQSYLSLGEFGYQYRNAVYTRGTKFHYALRDNAFDTDVTYGNWRFLKEGRTMVAVRTREEKGSGAMEVAIEGVDYPTLDDFVNAVQNNTDLGTHTFLTSKGDKIGYDRIPGTVAEYGAVVMKNGNNYWEFVWTFPFPRIQTTDFLGRKIVQWIGDEMIVTRHGRCLTYNFEDWTVVESEAVEDIEPPEAPTGVEVEQQAQ